MIGHALSQLTSHAMSLLISHALSLSIVMTAVSTL